MSLTRYFAILIVFIILFSPVMAQYNPGGTITGPNSITAGNVPIWVTKTKIANSAYNPALWLTASSSLNATKLASGTIPGARLGAPTTLARGGVQLSGVGAQFYSGLGTWLVPAGGTGGADLSKVMNKSAGVGINSTLVKVQHNSSASDTAQNISISAKALSSTVNAVQRNSSVADTAQNISISGKAATTHNQAASTITSGYLDGDRLSAPTTTKRGGVPATGTPSGLFLRDDGTWAVPAGSSGPVSGGFQVIIDAATAGTTVTLPAGTFSDTNIYINKHLHIVGAGVGSTILDAQEADRIFVIGTSGNVDLSGMTLKNGIGDFGGAVRNSGILVTHDIEMTGNYAYYPTNGDDGGNGGAISNEIGATLTLNSGTNLHDNEATFNGGAVTSDGNLTINTGVMLNNNNASYGGALFSWSAGYYTVVMNGGEMSGNSVHEYANDPRVGQGLNHGGFGGAWFSDGVASHVTINGGSIDNNYASSAGGAIWTSGRVNMNGGYIGYNSCGFVGNTYPNMGGGIGGDNQVILYLDGGTIEYNSAIDGYGGGIFSDGYVYVHSGITIQHNTAKYGAGVSSDYYLLMTGGLVDSNTASSIGGGIFLAEGTIVGNAFQGGTISNNRADSYAGGIACDTHNAVTFDGTTFHVTNNCAANPASESAWYTGWGTYFFSGTATGTNGFSSTNQVTGNYKV